MSPLLEAAGLTRRFGRRVAVDRLDLAVAPGEILGLVGPDGAGKSTTLRLLAGLLAPDAGVVRLLGCDLAREPARARTQLGYMSQGFGLYPDLTVRENLLFCADLHGVPAADRPARLERLLGFSNLTPFQHRRAAHLSGGMKQKLALAAALIHRPRLLLLDEPTNGVDPISRRDFWRLLEELVRDGLALCLATTYPDEAGRCHRLAELREGRLATGAPAGARTRIPVPPAAAPGLPVAGDPVIAVDGLEKRFGDFRAVAGISFNVARGEIFGFLGPNGAGKSTTIRLLCGLLPPTAGTGRVAGFDLARDPERIKEHLGYMSQRFSLYEELTVEENIDFHAGIHRLSGGRRAARKEWVLELAGLAEHRRTRTAALAAGWRQRLALGCALLHEPPVLFLDEPTSGVDPESRARFWELIRAQAAAGVTVLVTTHHLEEAEYCDRVGIIYRGRMIADGPPRGLREERMPGVVLAVACPRPAEALAAAAAVPVVRGAALHGGGLRVVARDEAAARRELPVALARAGFAGVALTRVPPTLEDVFVALVEAHDRGDESGEARP